MINISLARMAIRRWASGTPTQRAAAIREFVTDPAAREVLRQIEDGLPNEQAVNLRSFIASLEAWVA